MNRKKVEEIEYKMHGAISTGNYLNAMLNADDISIIKSMKIINNQMQRLIYDQSFKFEIAKYVDYIIPGKEGKIIGVDLKEPMIYVYQFGVEIGSFGPPAGLNGVYFDEKYNYFMLIYDNGRRCYTMDGTQINIDDERINTYSDSVFINTWQYIHDYEENTILIMPK